MTTPAYETLRQAVMNTPEYRALMAEPEYKARVKASKPSLNGSITSLDDMVARFQELAWPHVKASIHEDGSPKAIQARRPVRESKAHVPFLFELVYADGVKTWRQHKRFNIANPTARLTEVELAWNRYFCGHRGIRRAMEVNHQDELQPSGILAYSEGGISMPTGPSVERTARRAAGNAEGHRREAISKGKAMERIGRGSTIQTPHSSGQERLSQPTKIRRNQNDQTATLQAL